MKRFIGFVARCAMFALCLFALNWIYTFPISIGRSMMVYFVLGLVYLFSVLEEFLEADL